MEKLWITGFLALFAINAQASLITIDPDDFEGGDLITGTSDYFDIRNIDGSNVYASPLVGEDQRTPENFTDSGPIGDRVFSTSTDSNREWMFPTLGAQDVETFLGLQNLLMSTPVNDDYKFRVLTLEFSKPVDYLSILTLQLFVDAGGNSDNDPQGFYLFSPNGSLINYSQEGPKVPLPGISGPLQDGGYAYFQNEFSFPEIGYVVLAGDSEPTTIDRLQFRYAKVPEPATLSLLALGLAAIGIRRRLRYS